MYLHVPLTLANDIRHGRSSDDLLQFLNCPHEGVDVTGLHISWHIGSLIYMNSISFMFLVVFFSVFILGIVFIFIC